MRERNGDFGTGPTQWLVGTPSTKEEVEEQDVEEMEKEEKDEGEEEKEEAEKEEEKEERHIEDPRARNTLG